MARDITRRDLIKAGAAGGAALYGLGSESLVRDALSAPAKHGRLDDIEHVVILIQENRSFDHYFGTYKGVLGFQDPHAIKLPDGGPVFAQPGYDKPGYGGHLYPFRLDTYNGGDCINDVDHGWGAQQRCWNHGRMDGFVREHLKQNGDANGPLTMGYYNRRDLPFYYALADAFTICDRYFCSMIGPTDPNRLYSVSATLDPDGKGGGPHLETLVTGRPQAAGKYTWPTYPEQLSAKGVSWKVYSPEDSHLDDNVLVYFKKYFQDPQLNANAFSNSFPGTFNADIASGQLPQVSWVLTTAVDTEHPPAPVTYGERGVYECLSALTSNPDVWAKTALFVTWDENGGFFDHVPPPVAPPGTPGEFLTVNPLPAKAEGIRGPIGLGFRVPMLIASPYARGGFVCSDTFDHTSTLRFLETRFGAEVPNLSSWRRSVTGDLTSAFNFGSGPNASVPALPVPDRGDPRVAGSDCPTNASGEISDNSPLIKSYPVPRNSGIPKQEPGRPRRPSGLSGHAARRRRKSKVRDQRYRHRRHKLKGHKRKH